MFFLLHVDVNGLMFLKSGWYEYKDLENLFHAYPNSIISDFLTSESHCSIITCILILATGGRKLPFVSLHGQHLYLRYKRMLQSNLQFSDWTTMTKRVLGKLFITEGVTPDYTAGPLFKPSAIALGY